MTPIATARPNDRRVLAAIALVAAIPGTVAGQQTGGFDDVVTRVTTTVPDAGASGIAADRPTVVRFSGPVDADTVGPASIAVTSGGQPVPAAFDVSLSRKRVRISYPAFLPADAEILVAVDGDVLLDAHGNPVDGDGDGVGGGVRIFTFETAPGVDPPLETGTAVILGHVFGADGRPLEGATIDALYYPGSDDAPPLGAPPAMSDASGFFQYETVEFTGSETFLVRIRKDGYSEALRVVGCTELAPDGAGCGAGVELLAGSCRTVDDAFLQVLSPSVFVPADAKGDTVLSDPTGQVELVIPEGALQKDSDIALTILEGADFIRDELPAAVATPGFFVDVAGVFGDETNVPVTFRIPNTYDLPVGTRIPLGKIDHNTLEWIDLRDAYEGPGDPPDSFLGDVKSNGSETFIEIQFDHFCTVCTGYCLPFPFPGANDESGDDRSAPTNGGPGNDCGNSVVGLREGYLWERVRLPGVEELGESFHLTLGYASAAADPSVTLGMEVDYDSTRPIERTVFAFSIEGLAAEAAYGYTDDDEKPSARFFWDGTNGLGQAQSTGSYPYTIVATSLNADVPVSIPPTFGSTGTPVGGQLYPGLTPLRSDVVTGRAVLIDRSNSPYGAGWSLVNESRLEFDADGCVLLLSGNSEWIVFRPSANVANSWDGPDDEVSTLARNPVTGKFVRTFPDGSVQVFGSTGLPEVILDRFGKEIRFTYSSDLLIRIESATGHVFELFYDASSKLERLTDSTGRTTHFSVDANGDLAAIVDASGSTRSFNYDSEHRLVAQTGPRGERSEYVYENGRVVETLALDVDGTTLLRRRQFQPSALDGELLEGVAIGLGTLGQPIPAVVERVDSRTDGRGFIQRHEADGRGRTTRVIDELGRATRFAYDAAGRLASIVNPNDSSLGFTYDDATGRAAEILHYDENGRLDSSRSLEWTGPFGQLEVARDPEGRETRLGYDNLGRVVSVSNDVGGVWQYEYENAMFAELTTAFVQPSGVRTAMTYDVHGNVVQGADFPDPESHPLGRVTELVRDSAGRVTELRDADQNSTQFAYDDLDRVTSVTDARGEVYAYSFDETSCGCATNLLSTVTLPGLATVRYTYDGLGRLTAWTDPLGRTTFHVYDPEGNLVETTNRASELVRHTYDAAGQLVLRELPSGEKSFFVYDELGNLSTAWDGVCQLGYERNFQGRVTRATTEIKFEIGGVPYPVEHAIDYTYDLAGNRTSAADDWGLIASAYAYDVAGRLETLTASGNAWAFAYDVANRRTRIERPGGAPATVFSYDLANQLTGVDHATSPVARVEYLAHNGAGQVSEVDVDLPSWSGTIDLEYDAIGELTESSGPTGFGDTVADATYTYDQASRLLSDGTFDYTYDDEGRLVERVEAGSDRVERFAYDALGRLRTYQEEVVVQGQPTVVTSVTYLYDPLGRRIETATNGVSTRYLYDGQNRVATLDGKNRAEAAFVHGPQVDEPLAALDLLVDGTAHLYADRIGTVIAESDPSGTMTHDHVYDEFGAPLVPRVGPAGQPYGFGGREYDLENELYYLRARYYDPSLGRFLTEDPLGLVAGPNPYIYGFNSPLNTRDPDGRNPIVVAGVLGGAFAVTALEAGLYSGSLAAIKDVFFCGFDSERTPHRFWEGVAGGAGGHLGMLAGVLAGGTSVVGNFFGGAVGSLVGSIVAVDLFNWSQGKDTAIGSAPALFESIAVGSPGALGDAIGFFRGVSNSGASALRTNVTTGLVTCLPSLASSAFRGHDCCE